MADETAPAGWLEHEAFDVQREVGRGGMATIYLALETAPPHRSVALKVVHPHLAGDQHLLDRFKHEVRAHLGLAHPNVVEMIGWGRSPEGSLFLAMEYVEGPTLKDVLLLHRPLPLDLGVFIAREIVRGLGFAHARGLIHRDVKPGNVMLTLDGQVKIADFGIAKTEDMTRLTSTGMVIGTPAYMSPEQALAKPVDARSDLFSVGVVLYEMLSGTNPFAADNPATTLSRIIQHVQRPAFEAAPHLPAVVEDVLDSLLQKDPALRPSGWEPLVAQLDRCIHDEGLSADGATLEAFLANPDGVARRLDGERAVRHLERGVKLYGFGPANTEAALWDFFLATILDPKNKDARTWLEQVSSERGYSLQSRGSPRIDELEKKLAETPDHLPTILQLAKLHKAQGNFLQVIFHYRRAKALKPPDRYTRNQIDTLVSAQAAPIIDGTGVFAAPVESLVAGAARARDRAQGPGPVADDRAEGVGDFLGGVLRTTWGKAAVLAGVIAAAVIGVGVFFDLASKPSSVEASADDAELTSGDGEDGDGLFDRAERFQSQDKHAKASELYSRYVDQSSGGPRESEALFKLGDSLERQGRRPEALLVHAQNGEAHRDDWAARSLGHRGELLLLDLDYTSARLAYESMAQVATGTLEIEAHHGLATVARKEGRVDDAIHELEGVLPDARGAQHHAVALDLADLLAESGDAARAAELYRSVRDSADHHADTFRRAEDGLEALGAASEAPPEPVVEAEAARPPESAEPPPDEAPAVEDDGWSTPAPTEEPPPEEPPPEETTDND